MTIGDVSMIQSMTGFGAAKNEAFAVEVRSVNHRFLDISMKIPHHLGLQEMRLRNMLKEKFHRGRFDVLVAAAGEKRLTIKMNAAIAKDIFSALHLLKQELSLSGDIGIATIAEFRDLIIYEEEEIGYNEEALYSAFNEALSRLYAMRVQEGQVLVQDVSLRVRQVAVLKGRIADICPEVVSSFRERLSARLNDLLGDARYDLDRVLQEAALMAERSDISEEIIRLASHIEQMKKILAEGVTIGREIEFLLQEMNREVNTIASKSHDYRISALTIEIKTELEKIREQAQNIQ